MQNWFRFMGRLEGISFLLLLFIAMPLKYYLGEPRAVKIMGPAHGALFLTYCLFAFWLALQDSWSIKKHLLAYVAAVFPFGTFWFEKVYLGKK